MKLYVGVVKSLAKMTKSEDEKNYNPIIIHFAIPNYIDKILDNDPTSYPIAFPITHSLTTPNIEDEIMIFQPVDNVDLYYYFINYQKDETQVLELRSGNSRIGINIEKNEGSDPAKWTHSIEIINDKQQRLRFDSDGNLYLENYKYEDDSETLLTSLTMTKDSEIKLTNDNFSMTVDKSGEMKIDSKNNISIVATGNVNVEATGSATVKGSSITLDAPMMQTKLANYIPGTSGGFCQIPNCLFTGAPHGIATS